MSTAAVADPRGQGRPTPALAADTLAASMAFLLALSAVQPLVGFVRGVLFCRWLPPDELGRWDLAFGFLTVAGPLVDLGLPASMGRFVERYRLRGQLTAFLTWAGAVVLATATTGAAALVAFAPWVAEGLYNDAAQAELVRRVAICLLACVTFGFQVELLAGLRMFRVVSVMQLLRSVAFLLLGTMLVGAGDGGVNGIVAAYGVASLATAILSIGWLRRRLPADNGGALGAVWRSVLPLAAWVSLTNALGNLFDVVDRNLIVHFSGLPSDEALDLVGNYHSSRVVPLMFVTLGAMLASVLLPHLAAPWEAGDRRRAALRLNLVLKMFAGVLTAGGLVVLLAGPWLYDVALKEKFPQALPLLPWTLAYASSFALSLVGGAALVCTERARLGTAAYLGALAIDVALNLWLLPQHGLMGAAWASTVARLAVMTAVYLAATSGGLRIGPATWALSLAPLTAILGWPFVLAALAGGAILSPWLITREEWELVGNTLARLRRYLAAG